MVDVDTLVTRIALAILNREGYHDFDEAKAAMVEEMQPLALALTEARAELTALRQDANDAAVALAKVTQERDEARRESTLLRAALATSKDPCRYCQLPADEMARCRAGFPGCARADDLSGCPEFGSMQNEHELQIALAEVTRERDALARGETSAHADNCQQDATPAPPDEWTTMDGPPNGTPDTTEKT